MPGLCGYGTLKDPQAVWLHRSRIPLLSVPELHASSPYRGVHQFHNTRQGVAAFQVTMGLFGLGGMLRKTARNGPRKLTRLLLGQVPSQRVVRKDDIALVHVRGSEDDIAGVEWGSIPNLEPNPILVDQLAGRDFRFPRLTISRVTIRATRQQEKPQHECLLERATQQYQSTEQDS